VHKNLGLGARTENMASIFELTSKLGMIENVAVGCQDDLAIFVGQRLPACVAVEGAQPDVRETDSLPGVEAIPIGPTVSDGSSHATQRLNVDPSWEP